MARRVFNHLRFHWKRRLCSRLLACGDHVEKTPSHKRKETFGFERRFRSAHHSALRVASFDGDLVHVCDQHLFIVSESSTNQNRSSDSNSYQNNPTVQ